MKFTSPGGRVDLLVRPLPSSAPGRDGYVCVSVVDEDAQQAHSHSLQHWWSVPAGADELSRGSLCS